MTDPPAHDQLFDAIRDEYPPVLTTAQVGELLHVGARTVLAMATDGRLKASRLPGTRQYNFFREDVIRVLQENLVGPGEVDQGGHADDPAVRAVSPAKGSAPKRSRAGRPTRAK